MRKSSSAQHMSVSPLERVLATTPTSGGGASLDELSHSALALRAKVDELRAMREHVEREMAGAAVEEAEVVVVRARAPRRRGNFHVCVCMVG